MTLDMPEKSKRSWNFRKADWPIFRSKLEEFCELMKLTSLNNMVPSFNSFVQKYAKISIPRGKRKPTGYPTGKITTLKNLFRREMHCVKRFTTITLKITEENTSTAVKKLKKKFSCANARNGRSFTLPWIPWKHHNTGIWLGLWIIESHNHCKTHRRRTP